MIQKIILSLSAAVYLVATSVTMAQTTTPGTLGTTTATTAPAVKEEKKAVDLVCMQNAVEKRDAAIIDAFNAYHGTVKQALEARRNSMKAGWAISNAKERKAALDTAWKSYRDVQKNARKTLESARRNTWKTFLNDRKACGTRGASEDRGTEADDAKL